MNMMHFPSNLDLSIKQDLKPRPSQTKPNDDFSKVLDQHKVKNEEKSSKPEESKDKVTSETPKSLDKKDSANIKLKEVNTEITTIEDEKLKLSEDLAKILGIDLSALEDLLNQLQISLIDLLNKDVLQQFLMEAHNLEDSSELLLLPDISGQFKEITNLLEDKSEVLETLKPLKEEFSEIYQALDTENLAETDDVQFVNIPEEIDVKEDVPMMDTAIQAKGQGNITIAKEDSKAPEVIINTVDTIQTEVPEDISSGENFNLNSNETQFFETLTQTMGEVVDNNPDFQVSIDKEIAKTQQIEPKEIISQIVDKVKIDTSDLESQIKIDLKPEHLGKLSMEFVSKEGNMTANFMVESERVKAMIEQNIQQLKNALKSQDIIIEELEVTVGQSQEEFTNSQDNKDGKPSKRLLDQIDELMGLEDIEEETYIKEVHNSQVNLMA